MVFGKVVAAFHESIQIGCLWSTFCMEMTVSSRWRWVKWKGPSNRFYELELHMLNHNNFVLVAPCYFIETPSCCDKFPQIVIRSFWLYLYLHNRARLWTVYAPLSVDASHETLNNFHRDFSYGRKPNFFETVNRASFSSIHLEMPFDNRPE